MNRVRQYLHVTNSCICTSILVSVSTHLHICLFVFLSFCLIRAAPAGCGGPQARGPIGAVAASLRHSQARRGLDLALAWLWCMPTAAAPIGPLEGNFHMPHRPKKAKKTRSSCHGSAVKKPTSIHEDASSIPDLVQWVEDLVLP